MSIKIYNLNRETLKELREAFGELPIRRVEPANVVCVNVSLWNVELITHVAWIELRFGSSKINIDSIDFERIEII